MRIGEVLKLTPDNIAGQKLLNVVPTVKLHHWATVLSLSLSIRIVDLSPNAIVRA
jgi:hypothetical protein